MQCRHRYLVRYDFPTLYLLFALFLSFVRNELPILFKQCPRAMRSMKDLQCFYLRIFIPDKNSKKSYCYRKRLFIAYRVLQDCMKVDWLFADTFIGQKKIKKPAWSCQRGILSLVHTFTSYPLRRIGLLTWSLTNIESKSFNNLLIFPIKKYYLYSLLTWVYWISI